MHDPRVNVIIESEIENISFTSVYAFVLMDL